MANLRYGTEQVPYGTGTVRLVYGITSTEEGYGEKTSYTDSLEVNNKISPPPPSTVPYGTLRYRTHN